MCPAANKQQEVPWVTPALDGDGWGPKEELRVLATCLTPKAVRHTRWPATNGVTIPVSSRGRATAER